MVSISPSYTSIYRVPYDLRHLRFTTQHSCNCNTNAQGISNPDIVYDAPLSVAIGRTEFLLCGVDLER